MRTRPKRSGRRFIEPIEPRTLLSVTIYVDANATGAVHDGTSWATAFVDLQQGLAAAVSGDEIHVADGTYKPTSGTNRTISFALKAGVSLYGGYAGYGAPNPDARDIVGYPTILSGDIGTANSTSDNSYHVMIAESIGVTTVIDGLTVTLGNANGSTSDQRGGAGLAINGGSSLILTNCTFISNAAYSLGGGIYNGFSSSPALTNCTFIRNTATSGGAIYNYSFSSPTLTNCNFSGNTGRSRGGAIYDDNHCSPKLTNCILSGNTASEGGGLFNYSSSPIVVNCTFLGNVGSSGAAAYSWSSSSPGLTNCIVWGSGTSPIYAASGIPNIKYSDIQGGASGVGNINTDPQFVRSAWTGPDGVFGTTDDDYGDLRLRSGSPCLDVGSNAAVPVGVTTDLAGNVRIQNGIVDLGAYEGGVVTAAAKVIYVDRNSIGANDGTSWADAFTSLQSAILAASDGDTIRIADGIYKPTTGTDRKIGFATKTYVSLYGGFAGDGAPNPDARDIAAYATILSGDIGSVGFANDNSFHVMTATGISSSTVMDGVTVTLGNANGSGSDPREGGGLYALNGASLTLTNCSFIANSAVFGGGIYYFDSSPVMTNCTFVRNTATFGGAIRNYDSSPSLNNCTFVANMATDGGGVYNDQSTPFLTNCIFIGNSASGNGGGIFNSSSSPNLINCTLTTNAAVGGGGGMYNASTSTILTNCIVWDCGSGPITGTPTATYSDIEGGFGGVGNINNAPQFVRSPWTGPDGVFGTADDDLGDLRLRSNSACLDAGSNAAIPGGVTTDFAGNPRIQNGIVDMGAYEGGVATPAAKVVYVDRNSVGSNNGTSWADAFTSLQSAILVSNAGDTIRIADGTYKPTTGNDRTIGFALRSGVSLYGGYAGFGAPNPDARDVAVYATILSGDVGAIGFTTDNSYHVVTATGISLATTLDGLTVTLGNANGSGYTNGGGLSADGSSALTVANCIFSGNAASFYGGGIYNGASSPLLINCTFSANKASSGGGIYNFLSSSPVLNNCSFIGNTVNNRGGGIYNSSSSPFLTNCTFSANTSSSTGGAMYNDISSPTLINCAFNSNTVWTTGTSSTSGGGIYNSSSSPILTNCTFTANSASTSGGGVYNASSSPILTNCVFTRNTSSDGAGMYNATSSVPRLTNCAFNGNAASTNGGGMYNSSSTPNLINCIFNANQSLDSGGGMYNSSSSPILTNNTFTANVAPTSGDALYNNASSPSLTNCIVWGYGTSAIYTASGTPNIKYSDIQGGFSGVGNINTDPQFVRSPWTGPDGVFGTADDDYGDLHLRGSSPCLDIGSNAAVPAGVTTDLAGNVRIQNGIVDLGAYEGGVAAPAAKVIYVDRNSIGAGDGTSWADAFTSVQSAILSASDGDTIRIADGTYKPTASADRTISFVLKPSVSIYGGYAGYGAPNPDVRDVAAYATILSGDIGAVGSNADNSYHVVTATGIGTATVIDGLTVTLGNAYATGTNQERGGGLFATASSFTLVNCTFSRNTALYGGGMFNQSAAPTLVNCIFSCNIAAYGGGMYNDTSSPIMANCTFVANTATIDGGAMSSYSSVPILTNCIVWGSGGDPFDNAVGTPTITYSDIDGGYSGVGNISTDPQFVRSPWTGPDGVFGTTDDDAGDLRLRVGSPCINVGINAAVPGGVTTDLAGNVRIQNGTVDLGPYEGGVATPAAKVIYVDRNSVGANNGTSWANAYTSLQSAILAATDGDTVRIADGTYKPTTGTDRTISFVLKSDVSIYGGYAGYGAPNPDARNIAANSTILSGDIGVASQNDNTYQVLNATGLGAASMDGLTVTLGYAGGGYNRDHGGGLFEISSSLTLVNCTFSSNKATWSGGGMHSYTSSSTLINCTFSANNAMDGGGMYNDNSSATVINCTFIGNYAGGEGGAVYNSNYYRSVIFTNCVFSGNSAPHGGGMYSGSATLTNCTFVGNTASISGGGMYIVSSPIMINCTFSGNTATGSGGGIYNSWSSPTLTNCIVWGSGSAPIYNLNSTPVITYSDIQGGYAGTGNINLDPLFIASPGDLRLQPTSPCIDAGNNSAVPAGVTSDAAGNSRIVDYPGAHDPGAIVDMGAHERPVTLAATGGGFIVDGTRPGIRFALNNQVDASSIAISDVVIRTVLSDGSLGSTVDAAAFTYDPVSRAITFDLVMTLPDGNYRATLPAGAVSDTYGVSLSLDFSQDFFILAGDANRDRKVDINDLAILAANWNGSGKVFSQCDFNYDGKVDALDLGILSSRWQAMLPPPAAPAAPIGLGKRPPTRSATRVISLIL